MLKIIYAGTPEFSVPALEALYQSPHQVVAVYTQPDRPAGRGRKIQFSPVKECALKLGLPVIQPENFKTESDIESLKSLHADLMVVAAYGILLPTAILMAPRLGCINIHASLLPRWRGAAPIQRAILAGDKTTGITLMQMDEGLDTGDMLAKVSIDIHDNTSSASLHDELKEMGASLLIQHLSAIERSTLKAEKQDNDEASYAHKISKQEASIDWNKASEILCREIRAFNPWPVSHTLLNQQNVKIWSAHSNRLPCSALAGQVLNHDKQGIEVCCGEGTLTITEIQFAGKKRTSAANLLNARNLTNEIFGV